MVEKDYINIRNGNSFEPAVSETREEVVSTSDKGHLSVKTETKGEGAYKEEVIKIEHLGRTIYGVSYIPDEDESTPVVIFSHGFNGINKDFSANSSYLASRGIASICFDFCGGSVNSKSDFETTQMTIFTEKEDLCAVIDYAKQLESIDRNNIFLFGGSQGGLVSALVADEYPDDIKGLLLLFPAFSIPANWNERYPAIKDIPDTVDLWGFTIGRPFMETLHGYDVFDHIGKYDQKVLLFHGDKDEIVLQDYVEKAASMYPDLEMEIFPGEGHGFSEEGNQKVIKMTYEFVTTNNKLSC